MIDKKNIMLYGFSAFEKVRLFYYGADTKFVGWQEYTMDGTGQSIIKTEVDPKGYFWALGKTGQVQEPIEGGLFGGTSYPESSGILKKDACASFPPRLKINGAGRVAATDGLDMRIRSAPGLSQSVIGKVPEGSRFTVLDGPKCVDGMNWWKVTTRPSNITGWMAESDNKVYLIEPK
jgi:hypothetical protein